jgi:MGT family glycosyltransferase
LAGRIRDGVLRPAVMSAVNKAMVDPVNTIRSSVGLARVRTAEECMLRAPLILVASAEPFQYPGFAADCSRLHMIGPCEFDPPTADDVGWLDDIGSPLVLVSTSSDRQADSALGQVAIEAMADESVHVFATFPCGVPDDLVLPANATAVEFVPHGPVLDRAVCAITHGGMGVTQKALARGVPVCVVPFGRDQFEVARRVEVSRCGTRLPAKHLTPQRLKKKALEAMSMKEGARRIADGFAAAGGVNYGADLLELRLLTT